MSELCSKLERKLSGIHGIGLAKARELIRAGVKSLSDLKKEKYSEILPEESRIWLKYPVTDKIPRKTAKKIIEMLKSLNYIYPVGSYRRNAEYMSDIDLLTTKSIYKTVIDMKYIFSNSKNIEIVDTYNAGDKKISGILRYGIPPEYIHFDIFYSDPADLVPALLHFTGGKTFNIRTRAQAKHLGYKLNQYGLFKDGEKIRVNTEKELLDLIGVTWIPPEERE